MLTIIGVFYFIFGTIVGSFLNVVSLRYNTGRSIAVSRSQCFSCGKTLFWYELIPVFSFVAFKGKCHSCGSKISWQYPLVELLTGVLFLGVYLKFASFPTVSMMLSTSYMMLIISLLIVILVYDIRHKIIPNAFVYPLIALSLVSVIVPGVSEGFLALGFENWKLEIGNFLAGPILFLPFFFLWFFSRGKWMGLGDGKLVLGFGWLLGLSEGLSALVISFWAGSIIGLLLIAMRTLQNKQIAQLSLFRNTTGFTMKSEIPFAPFLILGFLLVFFFDISVLELFEKLLY